jgi:PhnB protein
MADLTPELLVIAEKLRHLPREDFRARLKAELREKAMTATEAKTPTLMPYLVAQGAARLVDFMKQTFGAEEMERFTKADGTIMHTAVRIGDSIVELGDGNEQFPARPTALHVYVPDADAAYQRALAAGATSLHEPVDQPYGDHEASVEDTAGNKWYIATHLQSGSYVPAGLRAVTPYLHPHGTDRLIEFLKQAFGAEEAEVYRDPADGPIVHAKIRIGDAVIEMSEAHGPYQPMPTGLHYYVADADAVYQRALDAGGISKSAPADQPYGERNATVNDPAGNSWFIATRLPVRK